MEPVAPQLAAVPSERRRRVFQSILGASSGITANLASLIIFVLIWKFASDILRNPLFPGPAAVARTFWVLLTTGDLQGITLFQHSYVSLFRVQLGLPPSLCRMNLRQEALNFTSQRVRPCGEFTGCAEDRVRHLLSFGGNL